MEKTPCITLGKQLEDLKKQSHAKNTIRELHGKKNK